MVRIIEAEKLHEKWRETKVIFDNKFLGVPIEKNPLDAWVYQEIIWETKPDLIIECGSAFGGSALYMAIILDVIGKGRIISIDNSRKPEVIHPRIKFMFRDTMMAKYEIEPEGNIMVILDSSHDADHVLGELELYNPLVGKGQYLIVEDTFWESDEDGRGPMWAINKFLETHKEFEIDKSREKWGLTYNENGYLKKI